MATRNANSRPHCVDIAPSAYSAHTTRDARRQPAGAGTTGLKGTLRSLAGSSVATTGSYNHKTSPVAKSLIASSPKGETYRQTDIYTGAVRRSPNTGEQSSTHFGKLATAVIVITGAAVWTTGASESIAPLLTERPETVQATIIPPAFFFDDDADALERQQTQLQIENALVLDTSITPDHESNDQQDVVAITTWQDNPELQKNNEVIAPDQTMTGTLPSTQQPSDALTEKTLDTIFEDNEGQRISIDEPANDAGMHKVTVAVGDTLSGILNNNGLKGEQLNQLLTNDVIKEHLSNIDIGQVFDLTRDEAGQFKGLTTRVGSNRRVSIDSSPFGFDVTTVELPIERQRVATSGKINQSLYLAAERANLKQSTIMELANIFQWELDFARDIRQGDRFSLVYDRLFREGEYIGDGDILAAEFVRGGKSYTAIRFTTDEGTTGYYSPEGDSKRRTFLRHPVDVVRITSRFDPNRLHPVLHQIRAHRGVDYGSPHGSPIYATADGRVIHAGNKSAYGKTVVLKHAEKFSTLYAHMSRISDKSQVGKRVKQGDVIGYVGKTGRVTGTHLHYEFRVNGKQIDPLKVELPAAAPIEQKYLKRLKELSVEMSDLMTKAREDADKQVASGPAQDELLSGAQR